MKPPEHHESNDITRVLGSVQEAGAALVELLAAVTAAEPAIALRRALRPMTGIRQLAQVLTEPSWFGPYSEQPAR